jgi:RNA polymerase sigma factor (sigma-70 family)
MATGVIQVSLMSSDAQLLERYARQHDEAAFAELVRTHVDLVYSAAARRMQGDPHAAAEVTQEVFLALAVNAGRLTHHPALGAWLHTCTRNAAANLLRHERRRARHHEEAHAMQASDPANDLAQSWAAIRSELDAALDELGESDRQAIVLRFFENESYPVLGARLGLKEEAARMRVSRALDKLRGRLARRGIASTATLLAAAMSAHGVTVAPAGLALAVSNTALGVAGTSALAAATMTMSTKASIGLAAAIAALCTGGLLLQANANTGLREDVTRGKIKSQETQRRERAALAAQSAAKIETEKIDRELLELQSTTASLRERLEKADSAARDLDVIYEPGMLTKNLQAKKQASLIYPDELRGSGIGGTVIIRFVVAANGTTRDLSVEKSPHPKLSEAAIASLSRWTFEPGRRGDLAVNTWLRMPVAFKDPGTENK